MPEEEVEDAVEEDEVEEPQAPRWAEGQTPTEMVFVETGRGNSIEVPVGANFQETVERIADEAHDGGYFRVFLNGEELINPTESPETIQAGQRVAITSYDKVGN